MGDEYDDDWEQSYDREVVGHDDEPLPSQNQIIEERIEEDPPDEEELIVISKHDDYQQFYDQQRHLGSPKQEDLDQLYDHEEHGRISSQAVHRDTSINQYDENNSQNVEEHQDEYNLVKEENREDIRDPPYRPYIDMQVDLGTIADEDVLKVARLNIHSSPQLPSEDENGDDGEDQCNLPLSIRNELTRLSAVIGFTAIQLSSESDITHFLEETRLKVEKLRYASISEKSQGSEEQDSNMNYSPGGTRKKPSKLRNKLRAAHEQDEPDVDSTGHNISSKIGKLSKKAQRLEESIKESFKKIKPPSSDWETRYRKMVNKYRKEKDERMAYEEFIKVQNRKVRVLVDHVEKLMKAIKYENGKRMQLYDDFTNYKKNHQKLEAKFDKQNRYIAAQNRALSEVTQGSKILEDQLKLMDEKYLELRAKLDFARNFFSTTIKKIKIESQELRIKYAHASGGVLLDHVKIPKTTSFDVLPSAPSFRPNSSSSPKNVDSGNALTFLTTGDGIPFDATVGSIRPDAPCMPLSAIGQSDKREGVSMRPKSAGVSRKSELIGSKEVRPQSAFPSSPQRDEVYEYTPARASSGKVRPKSAAATMESPLNRLSVKEKEKALTYLCKKINEKDKNRAKEKWTADKLADLLSGSS